MTERPDTAAIRAEMHSGWYHSDIDSTVTDLCDALDAARAQLNNCWRDRMEIDQRAEAAEARIAAAQAVIAGWDEWDREPVRRALTGGAP